MGFSENHLPTSNKYLSLGDTQRKQNMAATGAGGASHNERHSMATPLSKFPIKSSKDVIILGLRMHEELAHLPGNGFVMVQGPGVSMGAAQKGAENPTHFKQSKI